MTLAQIWEGSRHNQYSWLLPCILGLGFLGLLSTAWIKHTVLRRFAKTLLCFGLVVGAVQASYLEIVEKWRIRHEWADGNKEAISHRDQEALNADGANVVLGPIILGGKWSLLVFGPALFLSSFLVRRLEKSRAVTDGLAIDASVRPLTPRHVGHGQDESEME